MRVKKRNGTEELMQFDKITERIRRLCEVMQPRLDPCVDPAEVSQKVVSQLNDGITTVKLDAMSARVASEMNLTHPDYGTLAVRIAVSSLHKQTHDLFSDAMEELYNYVDPKNGKPASRISAELIQLVREYKDVLNDAIQPELDYNFDYFGFMTLRKSYLMSFNQNKHFVERPGYAYMRIALGIHGNDIERALETYRMMANHLFTHATPTMYNAGTPCAQMSSCFLTRIQEDSISGIYKTLKDCAIISQHAGGIGISAHHIRAHGSYIRGSGGVSNGLFPMLKNYEWTARYVDQGGGKRKGSFAIYLEPWHADILIAIEVMRKRAHEMHTTPDLFYGLWVPNLFMERVERKEMWSLFCPNEAPGLNEVHGKEFEELYLKYEADPTKVRDRIDAAELMEKINCMQIETGRPYFLYKDACNFKSNHRHLGTIQSSNLCTEIVEYTSPDEIAVCNLASVNLAKCVILEEKRFDFNLLAHITRIITRNLNNVIDRNYYPLPEARYSNLRHRPIGIGIQGLADAFAMLHIPFESNEARMLNRSIFETMYYAALDMSCQLAEETGLTYETYVGSPMEKEGKLQFDLWADEDVMVGRKRKSGDDPIYTTPPSDAMWPWSSLRKRIREFGIRNSLLLAPMPTASTASILGNAEAFDPYFSNIFVRRVLAGNFAVINKHLIRDLQSRGLWNAAMKDQIMRNYGSVQKIANFPEDLKAVYKTIFEIKQKALIQLAADRGRYICQSQSMTIYFDETKASTDKLSAAVFMGYRLGLKTGVYYVRTLSAKEAQQFTLEIDTLLSNSSISQPVPQPSLLRDAVANTNGEVAEEDELGNVGPPVCFSCGV